MTLRERETVRGSIDGDQASQSSEGDVTVQYMTTQTGYTGYCFCAILVLQIFHAPLNLL